MHSSFSKFSFLAFSVSFEESSLQRCKFQISVETCQAVWRYKAILYIAIAHILLRKLILVTITRHGFKKIFQTEHFSAVKLAMG